MYSQMNIKASLIPSFFLSQYYLLQTIMSKQFWAKVRYQTGDRILVRTLLFIAAFAIVIGIIGSLA